MLGHEVSGEVAAVGDGVERVRPGDRVTTETYFSTCGICRFCRAGRINLCPYRRSIGSAVNGGFTSYLIVPERNVHLLPEGVSYLAGALTEPLACVVHGALELPRLLPGDLAVIAGPGAIGLLTLQVVRAAGARVVMLGTDADAHRLRMASDLGAETVLNVQQDDYRAAIDELTKGVGADSSTNARAPVRPRACCWNWCGAAASTLRSVSSASRWSGIWMRCATRN